MPKESNMHIRSKLFVPGSRPELFDKAQISGADAISFDLEDAVVHSRKEEARANVRTFLESSPNTPQTIIVRTNPVESDQFSADVHAVTRNALHLINLPKVEAPEEIHAAIALIENAEREYEITRPISIIANIESPRGLRRVSEIACAHSRVVGLQIGYGDLFAPLGIDRRDTATVHSVMFAVRLAAGEFGLFALDGAFTDVADTEAFAAEATLAKKLGYEGKSCVHPNQIQSANAIFRPSDDEIKHSIKVLEIHQQESHQGIGAFVVDGKMVDEPLFRRAAAIVDLAKQMGILPKQ